MSKMADPELDTYVQASIKHVPELHMEERTARSVTGDNLFNPPKDSGDETKTPERPEVRAFGVTPADLRGAQNYMLNELNTQVDEFESFKADVLSKGGWIFYAENEGGVQNDREIRSHDGGSHISRHTVRGEDLPPVEDPNPDQTQMLVDTQLSLLKAVGGSIQAVAQYVVRVNNAAQFYAEADKQSFGETVPTAPESLPRVGGPEESA